MIWSQIPSYLLPAKLSFLYSDGPKVGEKRKNREPELIAAKKVRSSNNSTTTVHLTSKQNAISIDHWNKRKQEGEDTPAYEPVEEVSLRPLGETLELNSLTSQHIPDPLPYGDPVKFQCLLCSRQFKSIEMLQKHSDQSSLHKVQVRLRCVDTNELTLLLQTNLNNQEAVDNAKEAKAKLQPAYRDRAAERRVALNQPDRPVSDKPSFKRVKAEALPATDSPPVQPNKDGIEEGNIGRKLLEAAGWSKGEGLGDAGKADPIEARQYQAGAGIGAAPSTAISDLPQDSNWNSAERGRDKARSRYIT